ncbi:toll/interleukin-1 receptor domain-containing protein [Azohydromonas aeria]|uniref:toll/interleukin-1 receptor domain-containing protein n=1 Tax=Azohydromonas aeria TaxID=2590212 RepID=UPI0012F7CC74|nr:toll/interleukin-1 receptor domain-containing protein [Azohydromonas aeria]
MARVFISYSHKDENLKNLVCSQLSVVEDLLIWDDRKIEAGDDWLNEIEKQLATCDVALLLVSSDFLNSIFIKNKEVPPLFQRQRNGVRIIPIILRPCAWKHLDWLQRLQAWPKDGRSLSGMSDHEKESVVSDVASQILQWKRRPHTETAIGRALPPERIDLSRLPVGAQTFLGRGTELQSLDAAWENGIPIVELVAPGGAGKTSLVKRWLDGMRQSNWRGARYVYGWSFFSQGTNEDKQASDDVFISEALQWFGVKASAEMAPADKGRKLAEAVAVSRTLLVLDGIEPLQYPPGIMAGALRTPGVEALLGYLAMAGASGLCLLTTRESVRDLVEYERTEYHAGGTVLRISLGNLSVIDGAQLLHRQGVVRAGTASIPADDEELQEASREAQGHALTLSLLGSYLAVAHKGDIRKRDQVNLQEADIEMHNGHAFKVMAAYERWFEHGGNQSARELAALRMLGFFDRPTSLDHINVLRTKPAISGLTEPLIEISEAQWRITLKRLEECGLIYVDDVNNSFDAHPLVREYLATSLSNNYPDAWREGHYRIYKKLEASAPPQPDGLAELQPLFHAVSHACLAGFQQDACALIFRDRIRRGENYSISKLGAFGADLGAVACFFDELWCHVSTRLSRGAQIWLLTSAAFDLRALGRLAEALVPNQVAAEMCIEDKNWQNAAITYGNLSEIKLTLGEVAGSIADARAALKFANKSGDIFLKIVSRTTLADALHQQGDRHQAAALFDEAGRLQFKYTPQQPRLYALQGFRTHELLMASAERLAWFGKIENQLPIEQCNSVIPLAINLAIQ